MNNGIKNYVGKYVKVTEVNSKDPSPGHEVGDIVRVADDSADFDLEDSMFDGGWVCLVDFSGGGATVCRFELVESKPKRTRTKPNPLYLNSELADEIDEDPEQEEIFIDLRGLHCQFDDRELGLIIGRIRDASINRSGDPPEFASLTCLVD